MESVSNKRVPVLRFKDDGGEKYREWKKRKIKEICEVNPPNDKLPEKFTYIDLESVNSGILVERNKICKTTAPSRAQRLLRKHDVLIQTVRPYQQNNLYFELDGDYVASTGYAQLRSSESSKFLYFSLHVNRTVNKILASCTGTSYPAINSNDLANISINLPQLQEQQKIANFLSSIDTRIEQLDKKKVLFKQFKKGMMQKLFSREIRFRDERGEEYLEWEETRLRDIFSERNETGNSKMEMLSVTISNGVVRARDLDRRDTSPTDKSKYKKVVVGDIPYNSMRMWQGASGVSRFNGIVSPAYTVIFPKDGQVPEFWGYYFKLTNVLHIFQRHSQGLTSDTWNLKFPALSGIKLFVSIEEEQQQKIANILSSLDRKIELIDEQIEKIREFKKGLLQQMFV